MGSDRGQPVRKLLLNNVLGKELRQSAPFGAALERFEIPASDSEVVGGRHRHDISAEFGSAGRARLSWHRLPPRVFRELTMWARVSHRNLGAEGSGATMR